MVLRSQNGFTAARTPAGIPGGVTTITPVGAPDSQFRVRAGDVATVLQYVLDQYQARVENIDLYTKGSGDDWGYAFRPIRGQTSGLSNHSSASAVDVNSTRHPLGTNPLANFTTDQVRAIRNILREVDDAVAWGGNYHGRKDGMHFEVHGSTGHLAGIAARIRSGAIHGPGKGAPPPPRTPAQWAVAAINAARTGGAHASAVADLQRRLNVAGATLTADGYWGPKTQAALDAYRVTVLHYSGADATGGIGVESWTRLGVAA